jgi:hypothetical protein
MVLPAAGGSFKGKTKGKSALAGACAPSDKAPETVYAWTPAKSGTARIDTCGKTTYDTVVYVRNTVCNGREAACNNDSIGCTTTEPSLSHGSRLSMLVLAGETYMIVVDGRGDAKGDFTLNVTPPP